MVRPAVMAGLLVGAVTVFALAQAQQGERRRQREGAPAAGRESNEGGDRREGRRGGAGFGGDPAQYRERQLEMLKTMTGATDDEWKTLAPKVEKVQTAQRDTRPMMAGFAGRRGAEGGQTESAVAKAQQELRTALQDKATAPDDITKKLAALREARAKAKADLEAAQKDLKSSVNPRQEAALVLAGLLD